MILQELVEMENLMEYKIPSQPKISNNEYISLCNYTIVYRNITSNNIFKWIEEVQFKYQRHAALLLVRQIDYELHLLWSGTIPREFWMSTRRPPTVIIKDVLYNIVSSKTIAQEINLDTKKLK